MKIKTAPITSIPFVAAALVLLHTTAFSAPLSLSLQDSVTYALQNNPAVKIAQAEQEKSAWGISEAEAGKLPTVSLGSSYNIKSNNPLGGDGDLSNSLRLSMPLYSGGRIEGQIDQAKRQADFSIMGLDKAKAQVKLDTITSYYTVLQTANLLEVNNQTVANMEEHLQSVQAKYDVGVVAKSDLLRSEVELANARQNAIKAENSYLLAKNSLLSNMMLDPGTELSLTESLQYQNYDKSMADSLDLAKKNRPDIAQAQITVAIAATGIDLAKSGRLPSVSLGASNGWSEGVLPSNDNWTVGVSASWNLYDAGTTGAKIKQADASLTKAQEQARQIETVALLEVRQNYLSMAEAEKRLGTTDVAVSKAQEDLYIAREKYNAGIGTNLDVIDAQLALTQAKTNRIQALYDYNVSVAKLNKAIGMKAE